jgi:hypothetical protein
MRPFVARQKIRAASKTAINNPALIWTERAAMRGSPSGNQSMIWAKPYWSGTRTAIVQ